MILICKIIPNKHTTIPTCVKLENKRDTPTLNVDFKSRPMLKVVDIVDLITLQVFVHLVT